MFASGERGFFSGASRIFGRCPPTCSFSFFHYIALASLWENAVSDLSGPLCRSGLNITEGWLPLGAVALGTAHVQVGSTWAIFFAPESLSFPECLVTGLAILPCLSWYSVVSTPSDLKTFWCQDSQDFRNLWCQDSRMSRLSDVGCRTLWCQEMRISIFFYVKTFGCQTLWCQDFPMSKLLSDKIFRFPTPLVSRFSDLKTLWCQDFQNPKLFWCQDSRISKVYVLEAL
jgi:hypothetical protein